MTTIKEAKAKYGIWMYKKMIKTGLLRGVTYVMRGNEPDIPQEDFDNAYNAVIGRDFHLNWD